MDTAVRERLRQLRKALGLSQAQLAAAVHITQQHYSLIERGLRNPSLDIALAIAQALDADPRDLFSDVLHRLREAS